MARPSVRKRREEKRMVAAGDLASLFRAQANHPPRNRGCTERIDEPRLHQIEKAKARHSIDLRNLASPHRRRNGMSLAGAVGISTQPTAQPVPRNASQPRRLGHRIEADAEKAEISNSGSVHGAVYES